MTAADLGQFAQGVASWRKLMAAMPDNEARWEIFGNAAHEIAAYVPKGLDRLTAVDQLQDMATAYGLANVDHVQTVIADAFREIEHTEIVPDVLPRTNGHDKQPTIEPSAYVLPDPSSIAPRAWLYGTHYMRGTVTATVAPGGFGKTTLALYEALYMVNLDKRVWYISGEDDRVEIDRRIAAHIKTHGAKAFADRLFVDDKISFPLKIARSGRNGPEFDGSRLIAFEQAIARCKIDVVILDPFVSFHLLSENDTAAMDSLVKRLGEICVRCNCSIELSHHVRKPGIGQFEISVYDARGAAAIVNAVRSCRVLNQMSLIEAQQVRIKPEHRATYIRIDSGKRNMAPPERARWSRLVSVEIANGDKVQALEVYEFKPETVTSEDADWVRLVLATHTQFRADSRSPEWFGHQVAHHFNRDVDTKGDVIWINKQIRKWIEDGVIRKVTREDKDRKPRMFFELVQQQASKSDSRDVNPEAPVGNDD